MLNQVSNQIVEEKAIDLIISKSNITETEISIDEFVKETE
jgi:hypothetical protein